MLDRDSLFTFKNIVLDDHTYLRVGDIIQTDEVIDRGIAFPVLDAIESPTDPLVYQVRLENAHRFGNIFLGDDLDTVQQRVNEDIKVEHRKTFYPTKTEIAADDLAKQLSDNQDRPKKAEHQFYTVDALGFKPVDHGILASVLVTSHQTKKTFWAHKVFTVKQQRALYMFKQKITRGTHVFGEISDNGWIKYIRPCR